MKAIFVFSGQGAQFVGMGKDLKEASPAAAAIFAEADKILGWSVSGVCFEGPEEKLTESRYCQPAIYTMSAACLAAFREKNPSVQALGAAGLSLGEYAAMYAAGVLSFANGLRLVARRAELMDEACRQSDGAMASVLGGEVPAIREVCALCEIDVANYNCPGQVVISGARPGVEKAIAALKEKGFRKVIPLKVAGAYHSRLMQEAGDKLRDVLAQTPMNAPTLPVAQNFIGAVSPQDLTVIKDNLYRQVAGSVRWEDCVRALAALGADTVIEFGPGAVLTGLAKRIDGQLATANIGSLEGLEKFGAAS
ncbi:MAG: [acyl-carrier-protein] S-malonyltransferase [Lentisphaerae bacterium GWF2_52_8]|nr:MAG: [acyl-carrier-protein] S-malonyltransferase [Lentisphaerae bacterium GWF2_52_8]